MPSSSCAAPSGAAGTATAFPSDRRPKQPKTNAHRTADLILEAKAKAGILIKAGKVSEGLLDHYLAASGSTYTIDINDLMADQPPLYKSFLHYLHSNATAALQKLKSTPANLCASLPIDSGWVGYVITNKDDWYYALRSFAYQLAGSVWIGKADSTGDRAVQIRFRAFVGDTYNFNTSDPTYGKYEQLAIDGWAADFLDQGSTTTFLVQGSSKTLVPGSLGIPVP